MILIKKIVVHKLIKNNNNNKILMLHPGLNCRFRLLNF